MEIKEMTIEQIEERKAELAELVKTAENLDEISAELDELKARKAELVEDAEKRSAMLNEIAKNEEIEVVTEFTEERNMENVITRNSKEYIDAYAEYIKSGDDTEVRSLITENGSGTVAVPELVENITRHAWDKNKITQFVRKTFIKGNLKVGFEISADGALIHTEGAAANNEEKVVLGIVNLIPSSIKKWITVSDEAYDLRGEAFLTYVYEEVAYRIAKKLADDIIADIEACGTASTTTQCAVPVITEATLGMSTVAKAIAQLCDEADNPIIMMNKLTWAQFKAVQYANGYGADPFEGCEVAFNDTIKAYTAATTGDTYLIVGDLGKGAQANFPAGSEITFKVDDKSLAEKDLIKIVGRQYVGHDVVAPKHFCKVQK